MTTITNTDQSRPYTVAVYNGVDMWTECIECRMLNIPCSEDGAPELCDACEVYTA